MIRHGQFPWLECSSRGEQRLSAFFARPRSLKGKSIEEAYQAAKVFEDGTTGLTWKQAKGRQAVNQPEVMALYETWWREYISENPDLARLIVSAKGLQDMFGQKGHVCQASVLWRIRDELTQADVLKPVVEVVRGSK
jgi:hypothetical protein